MYKSGFTEKWVGVVQWPSDWIDFVLENSGIQEKGINMLPVLQKKLVGGYSAVKSSNIDKLKKIRPGRRTKDI